MKTYAALCLLLAVAMFAAPVAALDLHGFSVETARQALFGEAVQTAAAGEPAGAPDSVAVLQAASGNVVEMDTADYLVGCVAAEMAAQSEPEALKAQAVAAYTNVRRLQAGEDDPALLGADISDDPARHQGYLDENARREKWGANFDVYEEKLRAAVEAVFGQALTYDGAYITAAYCALCPGRTESAETVWGADVPYLQSVTSPGDRLSPDFTSSTALTADEVREKLSAQSGITLPDDPAAWITGLTLSENGTGVVASVTVGGKAMTGQQFRTLLGLRSPAFTVSFADGRFTFTCTGNGHGVGMSQYGADYMARQGADYREILSHYYPGTTLAGA